MSWLAEFGDELEARHVRRSVREGLLAELGDHLACEEDANARAAANAASTALEPLRALEGAPTRLGDARAIAGQCAEELAAEDVRRGAFGAFAALALTALVLMGSQAALGGNGYPGYDRGFASAIALAAIVGLVVGAQVALVAGTLAAWHALRRWRAPVLPAAEVALLRRQTRIGLEAGFAVCLSIELYVVNFAARVPAWWLAATGGLALLAAAGLGAAWRAVTRGAGTITLLDGPEGDIYDDLPPLRPLRGHPWLLWGLATLFCGGAFTVVVWHAEHSLIEGIERGAFEALAFSLCFALLGRAVGARGVD